MSDQFTLYILIGIPVLILNIVVIINIIKAGKYTEMTYNLLKNQIDKTGTNKEREQVTESEKKTFDKNTHQIWDQIQNENQ